MTRVVSGFSGRVSQSASTLRRPLVVMPGFGADHMRAMRLYRRLAVPTKQGWVYTTLTNNTGQDFFDLANTILANMTSSGVYTLRDSPVNAANLSAGDRYTTDILTNIIAARSKDGTVSQEQRKWRANLVANYSFAKESKLKGFGVGAGARWQDKGTIGYGQIILPSGLVAPDLSQPYFAPAQLNGDLFASYRRKVTKKIDWKLQVNFRNAFGNHSDIPIRANPDGSVPIVRIPLERTWFITNTFSF